MNKLPRLRTSSTFVPYGATVEVVAEELGAEAAVDDRHDDQGDQDDQVSLNRT